MAGGTSNILIMKIILVSVYLEINHISFI